MAAIFMALVIYQKATFNNALLIKATSINCLCPKVLLRDYIIPNESDESNKNTTTTLNHRAPDSQHRHLLYQQILPHP